MKYNFVPAAAQIRLSCGPQERYGASAIFNMT